MTPHTRTRWLAVTFLALAGLAGAPAAAHDGHYGHYHGHHHGSHCHWHSAHGYHCQDHGLEHLRDLTPAQKVTFFTDPEDAHVVVDGEAVQRDEGVPSVTLLEGVHRIQIRASGRVPIDREILVRGAGGRIMEFRLEQID